MDESIRDQQLEEINKNLKLNNENSSKFAKNLIKIANSTEQKYKETTRIALNFARQGLTTEEVLKRTKDSLILTKMSGSK